jgi:hypothetical protein
MSGATEPLFHEEQSFRQRRLRVLTAVPPSILSLLAIWQVALGHAFGSKPMSNASIIGWSIFLWLLYLRFNTLKMVTEVSPTEISVKMRGLFRSSSIALTSVKSARPVTFHPGRDWGGYGFRSSSEGRAFLADGTRGVELKMSKGGIVVIGSQRPDDLTRSIREQLSRRQLAS